MKAVIVRPASLRHKSHIFHISPIYFENKCINTTAWSVQHVGTITTLPRGTRRVVSIIITWKTLPCIHLSPHLRCPSLLQTWDISFRMRSLAPWRLKWSLRWVQKGVIMVLRIRRVPLGSVAMCPHATHFMQWCLYIRFRNIWAIYGIYGIYASVINNLVITAFIYIYITIF